MQETMQTPVLLFRARHDPESAQTAVQGLIATRNYEYPRGWYSVRGYMDSTLIQERLLSALSAFLAATALLLAFVGVHGLLSFSVSQRTRELGIRIALGAAPSRVRGMFLREGIVLGGAGVGIGVIAALAATRIAASLLFGVAPADPSVLVVAATAFIAIAIAGVMRPAMRAAALDPVATLRSE
jgi:ABC-type antimicrobial peptide transport system permease subunit